MTAERSASLIFFTLLVRALLVSADQTNITAEAGQNVTLTCRAPNNNITVVEWSRADLGEVFVYRNNRFDPDDQHPSFKNRVDLQDRQMKDGDVSVILKNVMTTDSGTYECRGLMEETRSWELISSITLRAVDPPGQTGGTTEDEGKNNGDNRGHHRLSDRLSVILSVFFCVLVCVCVLAAIKWLKNRSKTNSPFSPLPNNDADREIKQSANNSVV